MQHHRCVQMKTFSKPWILCLEMTEKRGDVGRRAKVRDLCLPVRRHHLDQSPCVPAQWLLNILQRIPLLQQIPGSHLGTLTFLTLDLELKPLRTRPRLLSCLLIFF